MDMHSIIVSTINDEPLFTAEQVRRHTHSRNVAAVSSLTLFSEVPTTNSRTRIATWMYCQLRQQL